jgi:FMN phosphatase YigB (HAD superfamily)
MDEERDAEIPIETRPIALMPGVREAVEGISLPKAVWANTRVADEAAVRAWLERAGLAPHFAHVVTSVDAGARKPARAFFECALARCGVGAGEVLFVGNQLNTDVAGAAACGIRTVWLSGAAYRSADDRACDTRATYTIETLAELPALLASL